MTEQQMISPSRWVVPLLWTPALGWCLAHSLACWGLAVGMALVGAGLLMWQLLEYCIHRFLFHKIPGVRPLL